MASKVNTKFIVILGLTLTVAVLGVAYVAVKSIGRSGEHYIQLGDEAMTQQKYTEAIALYGKAVYKDQRNTAWLRKWLGAMEKETPPARAAYGEKYKNEYSRALQALADADKTNYEANHRWIKERWDVLIAFSPAGGASLASLEDFVAFVEESLKSFKGTEDETKKLQRYRGLAKVAILVNNPQMKEADLEAARRDLESALAADPADQDAFIALCTIDWARSQRAKTRDDNEDVARINAEIMDRMAKFIAAHSPAAAVRRSQLRLMVQMAAQTSDQPVSFPDVLQDQQPRVEQMVNAMLAENAETIETNALADAVFLTGQARLPEARADAAVSSMFDHVLKARSDDASILLYRAQYLLGKDRTAEAEETLQQVVSLPDRPMSLEGLLRFQYRSIAVKMQTDTAFTTWENEKDLEKKAAAAKKAKEYRDKFVTLVGETSNDVLSIDARLALINDDIRGATTLLTRYNQQTNDADVGSVWLLGRLMARQGNAGAAKKAFERVLQIADERAYGALRFENILLLGKLAMDSSDFPECLKYVKMARKIKPDDKDLQEQEAILETLTRNLNEPTGRLTKEQEQLRRVLGVLQKAQEEATGIGADPLKAEATLREALKDDAVSGDIRIHMALVKLLNQTKRKDDAIAALDAALVKFPTGEHTDDLKKLREAMVKADPVNDVLAAVDKADAAPLRKHLARYEIYMNAGKVDEGLAQLASAAALAPDDPQVVEYQFDVALNNRDKPKLEELATRAEEKNLDQAGGKLYRARLLIIDGKNADAAQLLRNVVERDKLNFLGWRLLGTVHGITAEQHNRAGDRAKESEEYNRAAEAFGRALDIRPNDVPTINGLLQSLVKTQRLGDALALARKSERTASINPAFVEMFIQLEFNAPGGDKARAVELREKLAKLRPDDTRNKGNLAILQMEQRRWDEAKATIDSLRSDPKIKDDIRSRSEVAGLDARWFALQGKFAEAERVIDELIASTPKDQQNDGPYLFASEMFKSVGQPDRALAFLEKGRPLQDKKSMPIDREIGDVCFNIRRYPEAIAAYTRVLDTDATDPGDAVTKRMLECYLSMKDWAKFDELLASVGERAQKDSTMLVLAAEAAGAQGDVARASRLYDQAVASDPSNSIVFLKRGDFSAKDPSKIRDAIADLEQAARLAPTSPMPLMRLANLYADQKRTDDAVAQLLKALVIDPTNDQLRMQIIQFRMSKGDRDGAVDLVDQAIKLKPDSIDWLMVGGRLSSEIGRPDRAAEYGRQAWESEKSLRTAVPYVTALLSKTPQDAAAAEKVVNDPALTKQDTVSYRMLRTMALVRIKKLPAAEAELAGAIAKLDQRDPQQVELFMAGLDSAYLELAPQIDVLTRLESKTPFTGYLKVQSLMLRIRDEASRTSAATELEAFADKQEDSVLRAAVYRLLGSVHFQINDFAQSVACYKKLLAIVPNDVEALNNCAYIMATKLKQPADALPLAEKAQQLTPDDATVLDTVATVNLELKNTDKAAELFRKALEKSKTDNQRAPVLMHLARTLISQGKKTDAQPLLQEAQKLVSGNPLLDQQFGAELKDLLRQIDAQ